MLSSAARRAESARSLPVGLGCHACGRVGVPPYSWSSLKPSLAGIGKDFDGRLLFEQVVKMDLEGIVCKRKDSPYKVTEKPSRYWVKVKNTRYSQLEGREELFEQSSNFPASFAAFD